MNEKTKERITEAAALAKEAFGEVELAKNPGIINSIIVSLALDDLGNAIKHENETLTECIFRSAGHIAE